MDLEWDEAKRQSNIAKHRVDLLEAALIFEGWIMVSPDSRDGYGEVRYKAIGMVDGECYVVVLTLRHVVKRLISAWKGGRRDRAKYQESISRRNPGDEE